MKQTGYVRVSQLCKSLSPRILEIGVQILLNQRPQKIT